MKINPNLVARVVREAEALIYKVTEQQLDEAESMTDKVVAELEKIAPDASREFLLKTRDAGIKRLASVLITLAVVENAIEKDADAD